MGKVSGSIPLSSTKLQNQFKNLFYLYIIKSKVTNKYYVGQTNNIVKRIAYHNNGYCKSTKSGKP
ncbi:MAG TPA: hypothetical protein ENI57_09900 [Ignavibacteria bacterium]|nr:hypothetical protein [Ignavibacteria bacterium]